jgi:hypothetical protein
MTHKTDSGRMELSSSIRQYDTASELSAEGVSNPDFSLYHTLFSDYVKMTGVGREQLAGLERIAVEEFRAGHRD